MSRVMTSKGRMLDMGALTAQHERMVAMGNAKMNARGDLVGASGQVLAAAETMAADYNRSNPRAVRQVGLSTLTNDVLTSLAPTPAEPVTQMPTGLPDKSGMVKPLGKPRHHKKRTLNTDAE